MMQHMYVPNPHSKTRGKTHIKDLKRLYNITMSQQHSGEEQRGGGFYTAANWRGRGPRELITEAEQVCNDQESVESHAQPWKTE